MYQVLFDTVTKRIVIDYQHRNTDVPLRFESTREGPRFFVACEHRPDGLPMQITVMPSTAKGHDWSASGDYWTCRRFLRELGIDDAGAR